MSSIDRSAGRWLFRSLIARSGRPARGINLNGERATNERTNERTNASLLSPIKGRQSRRKEERLLPCFRLCYKYRSPNPRWLFALLCSALGQSKARQSKQGRTLSRIQLFLSHSLPDRLRLWLAWVVQYKISCSFMFFVPCHFS